MTSNRIYEQSTGHAKSIKLKTLNDISQSLCKIKTAIKKSSGFFLQIPNKQKTVYLVVSSYEAIPSEFVDDKKEIKIKTEIKTTKRIKQKIKLDRNERKIYCLKEEKITAIEILEKDILFNKVKFLKYDTECKESQYGQYLIQKKNIFILHYPKAKDLECNCGMIDKVKKPHEFQFMHTLYIEDYSPGSPILLLDEKQYNGSLVIGVHAFFDIEKKIGIGTFINALIENIIGKEYIDEKEKAGLCITSDVSIEPLQ